MNAARNKPQPRDRGPAAAFDQPMSDTFKNSADGNVNSAGVTRQVFIANVRSALEKSGRETVPPAPDVDQTIARLAGPEDDLVTMFERHAAESGMKVRRVSRADLSARIIACLDQYDARRIVLCANDDESLTSVLQDTGRTFVDWHASNGFDAQFEADAGITDVHAALAETGTLICTSGPGHSRGASLVPPVHICIVRGSDILPDMIDFWARFGGLANTDLPSSIAFITGPSKTADIEAILVTGVHGPKYVEVMLVEDA